MWFYDFVEGCIYDGCKFCILLIVDEVSWECLVLFVVWWFRSEDVLVVLVELFVTCGLFVYIWLDNGFEFIVMVV